MHDSLKVMSDSFQNINIVLVCVNAPLGRETSSLCRSYVLYWVGIAFLLWVLYVFSVFCL